MSTKGSIFLGVLLLFSQTASAIDSARPARILIQEIDGTPSVRYQLLKVPNGSLTDNTTFATLDFAPSSSTLPGGSTKYIENSASPGTSTQVFSVSSGMVKGPLTAQADIIGTTPTVIVGTVGQNAGLTVWQNSSGNSLLSIDSSGRLRFQTSVSSSTNEGSVWSDSTQKAVQAYVNGTKQTVQGVLFSQIADQTVSNTVTETTIFGAGVGTTTLPTNFFVAGKSIRIHIGGIYSTPALGATATVKIKYGSTVLGTVATSSLLGGASSLEFRGEATITCRSTGATGSVVTDGRIIYAAGVAGQVAQDSLNNGGAATTVDTTTNNALDVTVTWDASTTTRIAKSTVATVEVLN